MTPRPILPTLARTATAALLVAAGATVVGASAATAAPGDPAVVVSVKAQGAPSPGTAQQGEVLVTAAGGVPVPNQSVALSVDHGFFTTGVEEKPSVVGAPAGNLVEQGTSLTVTTDAQGKATFQLGIERDAGFDDDGLVAAVVTAQAGALTGSQSAQWSSATPLNGGSVQVVLSPQAQQENPVAPAVAGDRTYYDVVTKDQFGNLVDGVAYDLGFSGGLDDYDYSDPDPSDLTLDGDFWVVSNVPATITASATWDAPTYRYTTTTGTAAASFADVSGSAAASFYDIAFGASSFAMTSTAAGDQPLGTTVTQTVTVLDQRGNPVRGFEVQFFRFGPETGGGEERANRVTNARGQASYSFVGSDIGTAKVTAVVTDGVDRKTLVSQVGFRRTVAARLAVQGAKGTTDTLKVKADRTAVGAKVRFYRVTKKGALKPAGPKGLELDKRGKVSITVADRNGRARTTYVAVVSATATTFGVTTAQVRAR